MMLIAKFTILVSIQTNSKNKDNLKLYWIIKKSHYITSTLRDYMYLFNLRIIYYFSEKENDSMIKDIKKTCCKLIKFRFLIIGVK